MADAELISIEALDLGSGTQMRVAMDESTVAEYASVLEHDELPPCSVVSDGQTYWLTDGFHRLHAHLRLGRKQLLCRITSGSLRDAVLAAAGANATHGLRRSTADKRRAVSVLLADAEWSAWSDREISRRCGVSPDMVGAMRKSLTVDGDSQRRRYTTRHGTEATMDTSRIGTKPAQADKSAVAANDAPLPAQTDAAVAADAPPPAQADAAAHDDDRMPTLQELAVELEQALERERGLVALVKVYEAEDHRQQLVQTVRQLEHAERQQAAAMERAASWQRRAEFYERLLAKIGKAVGERNLDKILSAVQQLRPAA